MLILNKGEDFTFEDYQKRGTSNDSFYLREKKNSFRIKPLTVAVSIVLAGLSFSEQVNAVGYDSPWIVGSAETYNVSEPVQFNVITPTDGAIALIYGTVKYTSSSAVYTNFKRELTYNNDNSITVYGKVDGSGYNSKLLGAYSTNSENDGKTIQSSNNTIIFKAGSNVTNVRVYGAKIDNTYSSCTNPSSADSNTVIIEKGSNYNGNEYVIGGYAVSDNYATANKNKIIIGSGHLTNKIIAGWTSSSSTQDDKPVTMTGNEVYLYGDADVSNAEIYGGLRTKYEDLNTVKDSLPSTVITGNTLIFGYNNTPWEPEDYTIKSVNNFSSIRLDTVTWGKTITINTLKYKYNSTDSSETKIDAENVSFSGVEMLSPGDSYDMLTVSSVESGSIGLSSDTSYYTLGSTLGGTASIKLDGNTVTYTVNSLETQPQTHTAAMTMSAGTVALTQGGDTLSAAGFNLANSGITGAQAFSAVGGGIARVNTGSHVNVNTLNFSVGVGNNIQNDYGQLSVGAAFEAGFGKFKNHFNAGKADPYIKKNGDIKYYGIAVLSNMAFENLWHVNGALRYGRIETSQNRAVYNFNTNQTYDVDLSSYYIGAELGGGKVIKLDDLNSLDLYGKYFFLHQDGNTFNAGGKYELSSVNSHRLRLAGRYSHNYTPTTALYTGLGAEYEFDGKSELKVDGFWAKPSKTDGIRGFGELGVTITPASNKGLIFDFGIKGLLGDGFRGAWANAEMKYLF
jgi:hypothetical protein